MGEVIEFSLRLRLIAPARPLPIEDRLEAAERLAAEAAPHLAIDRRPHCGFLVLARGALMAAADRIGSEEAARFAEAVAADFRRASFLDPIMRPEGGEPA